MRAQERCGHPSPCTSQSASHRVPVPVPHVLRPCLLSRQSGGQIPGADIFKKK